MKSIDKSRKVFVFLNIIFLCIFTILCLIPLINVLALSFSSSSAASAGEVKLLPVDFTLKAYEFTINNKYFWNSFLVSMERVLMGVPFELFLTLITSYVLSIENSRFKARNIYVWFFVISMLFHGGMVATYMVVKYTGLLNSIFALILPEAVTVFNIVLMLNFFRNIPKEISESALIDGASHWRILWKIYVPLSMPAIATILVFILIKHWNSWFDGMIYMNDVSKYPLQTYLQSLIIQTDSNIMMSKEEAELIALISERTTKAAQVFIATLPIFAVYPFLQRYFVSGMTVGSSKE